MYPESLDIRVKRVLLILSVNVYFYLFVSQRGVSASSQVNDLHTSFCVFISCDLSMVSMYSPVVSETFSLQQQHNAEHFSSSDTFTSMCVQKRELWSVLSPSVLTISHCESVKDSTHPPG